jgi:cytochrome c oxidase subunit I
MILPGFGIISQVVATLSRKPVFGYLGMVGALLANGRHALSDEAPAEGRH